MGNRTGTPPSQDDDEDEETDSQSQTDETQQTGITDATPEPVEEEESPSEEPEEVESTDEPQGSGGGGVAPVDVPTEKGPEEHSTDVDEEDGEDEPESVGESEFGEQDDTDEDEDEFEFVYGDIVHDREEDLPKDENIEDLVVVNLPDETITEWKCDNDETIAGRNPRYPRTDNVVITVEMKRLDAVMSKWDEREEDISLEVLADKDISHDCYPSLRLELEEPSHLRTA